MYELVEEASKVLRTPPPPFDFENPPEDPKEIEKKAPFLGVLLKKESDLESAKSPYKPKYSY